MDKAHLKDEADRWILRAVGLSGVALLLDVVLFAQVLLKEDPLFWRNEGGYPVWLRDFVLATFYPLVLVQFVMLITAGICHWCAFRLGREFLFGTLAVAGLLLWLFFGIILVILVWNNVDNLLNGRPLHYHPS